MTEQLRHTHKFLKGSVLCLLLLALAPFLPVNVLSVEMLEAPEAPQSLENVVMQTAVANGGAYRTTYIHSVQLTPVIDEYRVVGGKIWGWEERVQSHNAGLPFEAPRNGRFLLSPPWMIVQGGRQAQARIAYRVGNDHLGKNTWSLPSLGEIEAYQFFPGQRLFFAANIRALKDARPIDKHMNN